MTARIRSTGRVPVALALAFAFVSGEYFVGSLLATAQSPATQTAATQVATPLSLEQQEIFLKKAKVVRTRGAGKGVTGSLRATLSDGVITHDAHIQTIDESKTEFRSDRGTELNFRDSWRYNVAAYRLDRLLELGMIPPSIERSYNSKSGAFTWWLDDVLMDEGERLKQKVSAPDTGRWNEQMWHVRLFDQLIYNVDRNMGNLVIDKQWTVWMIDHTRAFRLFDKIKTPGNLSKCDRRVFERLKALDQATLKKTMEDYLTSSEIKGVLARRDQIIAHLEQAGPSAIFDWRRGS